MCGETIKLLYYIACYCIVEHESRTAQVKVSLLSWVIASNLSEIGSQVFTAFTDEAVLTLQRKVTYLQTHEVFALL